MPVIIPRPSPWNALTSSITDWQRIRAEDEAREKEEKAKKKKAATIAAAAVGTVLTAGALAPVAAGVAGTAATAGGVAGAAAGTAGATSSMILPAVAATSGAFGTGGALSLGGTLALGSLGASLGGQIADGDYAGALGTAAGVVGKVEEAGRYGYAPSQNDKSAMAHQAAQLGTSLGAIEQRARQQGTTPNVVLNQMRVGAMDATELNQLARDNNWNATGAQLAAIPPEHRPAAFQALETQKVKAAHAFKLQTLEQSHDFAMKQLVNAGVVSYEPDHAAIAGLQKQRDSLQKSITDFRNGGGDSGHNIEELVPQLEDVQQQLDMAVRGNPRPPKPMLTLSDGHTRVPYGSNYIDAGRLHEVKGIDQNGMPEYVTSEIKTQPVSVQQYDAIQKIPDPAERKQRLQTWVEDNTIPGVGLVVPEGFKIQKSVEDENAINAKEATKLLLGQIDNINKNIASTMTGEDDKNVDPEKVADQAMANLNTAAARAGDVQAIMSGKPKPQAQPAAQPTTQPAVGGADMQKLQAEQDALVQKVQEVGFLSKKEIERAKEIRKLLYGE